MDTRLKFISIIINDKNYVITFRIGLFKGIYDIEVSTYESKGIQCGSPGIIPELPGMIWFEMRRMFNRIRNKLFRNRSNCK